MSAIQGLGLTGLQAYGLSFPKKPRKKASTANRVTYSISVYMHAPEHLYMYMHVCVRVRAHMYINAGAYRYIYIYGFYICLSSMYLCIRVC